jgi:D-apiose dehydrogenase
MAATLKLATAGTGYFSRFHYDAWARIPEVAIVGVCNRTHEGASAIAGKFPHAKAFISFEDMLETTRPDLVDIITPPETHLAYVSAAARRGIPAICQKAFCRDIAEAREAERAVASSPAPVIVHENFRFQPWHRMAKQLIDDGTLGDLYQVCFRLRPGDGQGPRAYLDRQPYFQTMDRFLIHETAIHLVDTFRYFFGEVASVYAALRKLNPVIAGEDAGLVIFDFANGSQGVFDGNRLADHAADNRRRTMGEMWIEGAKATLRLDGSGHLFLRKHGDNTETKIIFPWRDDAFGGDCVYLLQRHMIDHLTRGMPLENKVTDYLPNLAVEEAIYQSAATGQKTRIGCFAAMRL